MSSNNEMYLSMGTTEICNILKPMMKGLYKQFQSSLLSEEEFIKIVLESIDYSKKNYDHSKSFQDYLVEQIKNNINKQIHPSKTEPDNNYKLICAFISKNEKEINTGDQAAVFMKRISDFMELNNIQPDLNFVIDLLEKNKQLKDIVKKVFEKYASLIKKGNMDQVLNDETSMLMMEAYCVIERITIEESLDEFVFIDNKELNDSYRLYIKDIGDQPLLTFDEEQELMVKIKQGDKKAREELAQRNLRLVVSIAKKYMGRGLPLMDLIQEGNLGLLTSIDKFDEKKGFKFSTYATWWIRQRIKRSIADTARVVRLPVHVHEKVNYISRLSTELEKELKRTPTSEEIAKEMNLPVQTINQYLKLQEGAVSLHTLIGDDRDTELEEFISSDEDTPEEVLTGQLLPEQVMKFVNECKLSDREREILTLRFGLDGKDPMTLEEVGRYYNLTRERVRQLEAKAMRKLRCSPKVKELASFLPFQQKALSNLEEFREKYSDPNNRTKSFYSDRKKDISHAPRPIKTIYEYFSDYTKEQVDEVIEMLSDKEKASAILRVDPNCDDMTRRKILRTENNYYYNVVIPKMKRIMNRLFTVENNQIEEQIPREPASVEQTQVVEIEKQSTTEQILVVEDKEIGDESVSMENRQESNSTSSTGGQIYFNSTITKDDYVILRDLLKSTTFVDMLKTKSIAEAVVISLRFGLVNGKCFSVESISNFLNISQGDIRDMIQQLLESYNEKINEIRMRAAASTIEEKGVQFVKRPPLPTNDNDSSDTEE